MKNKKELLKYIDMCEASWSNSTSEDYIKQHGINGEVFNFDKTDVEGFWVEDVENVYIVFRGTEFKTKEILENFDFIPNEYGFHRGVAKKLPYKVTSKIQSVISGINKDVKIIGHSLGGAIARYIYYTVWSEEKQDIQVVTFGTYQTTRKKLLKKRANIKNYMISSDKVGLLGKLFAFFCGYKDKYIYLKKKGFWNMEDHDIKVYREVIENVL